MSGWPRSAFWSFSLAVYARPGVAPVCLDLQARLGLDVNLLLYGIWIGLTGRGQLTAKRLDTALALSTAWNAHIVRPLRQVRSVLKEKIETGMPVRRVRELRASVKAAELDAEHLEQLGLAALAVARQPPRTLTPARRRADAAGNALAILRRYTDPPAPSDRQVLETVLAAAYIKGTQAVGKSRRRA